MEKGLRIKKGSKEISKPIPTLKKTDSLRSAVFFFKLRPRLRSVSAAPIISSLQATPSTPLHAAGTRSVSAAQELRTQNLEQSAAPTCNLQQKRSANPSTFFFISHCRIKNMLYICRVFKRNVPFVEIESLYRRGERLAQ